MSWLWRSLLRLRPSDWIKMRAHSWNQFVYVFASRLIFDFIIFVIFLLKPRCCAGRTLTSLNFWTFHVIIIKLWYSWTIQMGRTFAFRVFTILFSEDLVVIIFCQNIIRWAINLILLIACWKSAIIFYDFWELLLIIWLG